MAWVCESAHQIRAAELRVKLRRVRAYSKQGFGRSGLSGPQNRRFVKHALTAVAVLAGVTAGKS
jgi:hypothetical protein